MGSTCSKNSTDIVHMSSLPSRNLTLISVNEKDDNSNGLPPEGFYPECSRTDSQLHYQSAYSSLHLRKNEINKREIISSSLRLFQENGVLNKVHSYVDAVSSSRPTFEKLSYLLADSSTPYLQGIEIKHHTLLKGYAIYYWVSNNIEYNLTEWNQMVSQKSYPTITPQHVFRRRSSVCSGYANLYHSLAVAAGLQVEVINGHFKRPLAEDSKSELFHPQSRNSHAWNAICIDKVWYLIDCTYGAGTVTETGFTKLYNGCYYAVPPEQLILTHWPDLPQWQLLEVPLELDELKRLIVMTPDVCCLGLSLDACEIVNISSDQIPIASVEIKLPSNYQVIPTLTSLSQDSSSSSLKYNRHTFVRKREDDNIVYAVLPNVGSFVLRIFIKDESSCGSKMIFCTSYVICCESELNEYCGFPKIIPEIANKINFELLYWTGHQTSTKSYISECTTGKMTLYFKTKTSFNSNQLIHMIVPGSFNTEEPSQQYHFYTSLTKHQLINESNEYHYKLNVLFPMEGLWTVCLLQRDILNDAFNEPLLLYQLNVRKAIKSYTYPWIRAPDDVIMTNKGPYSITGKEMYTLSFEMSKATTQLFPELKPAKLLIEDGTNYDEFIHIHKENKDSYKLMIIFPKSGKWLVDVFYQPMSSIKQFSCLFSLYFDVTSHLKDTIFPITNEVSTSSLNVNIIESLPLTYDSHDSVFCVHLSAPKSVYFNIKILPINYDSQLQPVSTIHDHWSHVKLLEDDTYIIKVLFHEAGEWSVNILGTADVSYEEASMIQLYEFKLDMRAGISNTSDLFHMLYPKLYPAFYDLHVAIPDNLLPYNYHISDKLLYHFGVMSEESDLNVVIFKDCITPSDKYHSQALVYPHDKNDKNKYILQVVFPEEGNWVIQLFSGEQENCKPVFGLYAAVKNPTIGYKYPWIHSSFFNLYQMDFKSSPNYLLPNNISIRNNFTLPLFRPQEVGIIHKAKDEGGVIIEGITCFLQTDDTNNEHQLSVNFTATGHWSILLYASLSTNDDWRLVLVHDIIVYS